MLMFLPLTLTVIDMMVNIIFERKDFIPFLENPYSLMSLSFKKLMSLSDVCLRINEYRLVLDQNTHKFLMNNCGLAFQFVFFLLSVPLKSWRINQLPGSL